MISCTGNIIRLKHFNYAFNYVTFWKDCMWLATGHAGST